jgi:hypothetical protein
MSTFYVDIVDRPIYYLTIDCTINDSISNIDIIKYNDYNLEIINADKILPTDYIGLIDNFPLSSTIGNLPISRLDFETPYGVGFSGLNNYLDQYEFECGTP